MQVDQSHIGKVLRWKSWLDETTFLLLKIEGNFLTGRDIVGGKMGGGTQWWQGQDWELAGPDAEPKPETLPASIEPLMKSFGCHEKQTRALVAAILKEVKENTR